MAGLVIVTGVLGVATGVDARMQTALVPSYPAVFP